MIRRVFLRTIIVLLILLIVTLMTLSLQPGAIELALHWLVNALPVTVPPPPVINASAGPLPSAAVGLLEWVQEPGSSYFTVGHGFLLQLRDGAVVGVTTAHSIFQGNPQRKIEKIAFGLPGSPKPLVESDIYAGPPGTPALGGDLTIDYILVRIEKADASYILQPDPRGLPQPGERVMLISTPNNGSSQPVRWQGSVQAVDPTGVHVYMDEAKLYPGGMSGSPVVSMTTGKVIGMAINAVQRRGRWLIGIHPIGSLVRLAETANEFPKLKDYQP